MSSYEASYNDNANTHRKDNTSHDHHLSTNSRNVCLYVECLSPEPFILSALGVCIVKEPRKYTVELSTIWTRDRFNIKLNKQMTSAQWQWRLGVIRVLHTKSSFTEFCKKNSSLYSVMSFSVFTCLYSYALHY